MGDVFLPDMLQDICKGNADAVSFCIAYAEMIGVLDDVIDKDKIWSTEKIVTTFSVYTTNLMLNNFVRQNAAMLVPVIIQGGTDFLLSEDLCKSSLDKDLAAANVLKSTWNSVFYVCAAIVGGQTHAIDMARKYRIFNDPKKEFDITPATTSVADYYDKTTQAYLDSIGDHFQITSWHKDRLESDKIQFNRIGVKNGDYILDAGCGVLGPALNLLKLYPDCKVAGVTVSEEQFKICNERIIPELSFRVDVTKQDYLHTNFHEGSFDGIMFLESSCYAGSQLDQLVAECSRLLKPRGWVYLLGWYLPDKDLSIKEQVEIKKHEAEWHDKLTNTSEVVSSFAKNDFEIEFRNNNIGDELDYDALALSRSKPDGSPSSLAKAHKTTAWFELLKMADMKFIKR